MALHRRSGEWLCGKSGGLRRLLWLTKALEAAGGRSGSFRRRSLLPSVWHGYFQGKRCECSRWVCHVLRYMGFEVIFNTWKNKIKMEENMSIYHAAGFASRGFFCFSPAVTADLPLGTARLLEQGQWPPLRYHAHSGD